MTDVAAGSPADTAGLKPGDIITAIDDKVISDESMVTQDIDSDQIGQKVKITYWRGKLRILLTPPSFKAHHPPSKMGEDESRSQKEGK